MRANLNTPNIPKLVTFSVMIVWVLFDASATVAQSVSMLASVPATHSIAAAREHMELTVKSSRILSLNTRIPRFQVHDEDVLDATPVSDQRIQISAKKPGTTQINVWDTSERRYTIDVNVVADTRPIDELLNSHLPLASLKVTPVNASAIVSGYVTRVDDVDRAIAIVEQFYETVINNIQVAGSYQVLLHTRMMEINRTKLRRLGLNAPWCHSASPSGEPEQCLRYDGHLKSFIQALEQQNLVKVLASPTVVTMDGRHARFAVGGRVPTMPSGDTSQPNVAYGEYGTSIDFLPTVIGPDRVRLKVRSEMSEPDPRHPANSGSTELPALKTRYVDTTLELHTEETVLLASLLQSRDVSIIKRTPVLGAVPGIGALFRHVHCEHNEIELLITITPEIVPPTMPGQPWCMPENSAANDEPSWAPLAVSPRNDAMIHQDENRQTDNIFSFSDLLSSEHEADALSSRW